MVIWNRFLYLLSRPFTLTKSSCSNWSMASSTLSHILASTWPVRSPKVSAKYGSPVFLGLTCLETTTKLEVMILFSWEGQSERKNSFMEFGLRETKAARFFALGVKIRPTRADQPS